VFDERTQLVVSIDAQVLPSAPSEATPRSQIDELLAANGWVENRKLVGDFPSWARVEVDGGTLRLVIAPVDTESGTRAPDAPA
jgi:hypothetical protein